nr:RNA-directed DNA polymerase, eukaryota [Tanacetum cinerariifolium]
MGDRSNEEDVQKISTSVFVTNFPDQFNAKDLWNTCVDAKNRGVKGNSSSYVNVVKGSQSMHTEMEFKPALVLDSTCVNHRDYSNFLLGKVKDIASLSNLKVWAKEISGWVPDFVEENEEESDTEDEINAPNSKFEEETTKTKDEDVSVRQDKSNSDDPFNIYDLLNKKDDVNHKNANEENSLKFPPGFTLNNSKEVLVEYPNKSNDPNIQVEELVSGAKKYRAKENAKADVAESMCSGHFQKAERPRGGVERFQFDAMLKKVEGTLLADSRDRLTWSLEGSGDFSVASVRKLLDDKTLPKVASKTRWIKAMTIKVNVHAWKVKVKIDCLPTRINLS